MLDGDLNGLSLEYEEEGFHLTRNFKNSLTVVSLTNSDTVIYSL